MAIPRRFVVSQVVEGVHRQLFARCVHRYRGDYKNRHFSCREGTYQNIVSTPLSFIGPFEIIAAALDRSASRLGLPASTAAIPAGSGSTRQLRNNP